jgi:hypothetical protein
MLRAMNVEGVGAKRTLGKLLGLGLLGCAACSSSGNDTNSADAGCAPSGDYPADGSMDPLYACSPSLTTTGEWAAESQAFHVAWSLIMGVRISDLSVAMTMHDHR